MAYDPEFNLQLEKFIEETKRSTKEFSDKNPNSAFTGFFKLVDQILEVIVGLKNDYDNSFDPTEKEQHKAMILQSMETLQNGMNTLLDKEK